METQEEIALPKENIEISQNNNNLHLEDEKTSITASNLLDNSPHHIDSDDKTCAISEEAQDTCKEENSSGHNNGAQISPQATADGAKPPAAEGESPDAVGVEVVIQSFPCNLQPQEAMEVAEQLEGLHFKNHTIGEPDEVVEGSQSLLLKDCSPSLVKIDAEDGYDGEESSSEDSSSDSDSDSSSTSSSSSSSSSLSSMLQIEDEPIENNNVPLKTKDELLVDELPAVEELSISLPDHVELQPFGTVSSVIEQLVIIESLRDVRPLNEDTVVFKEDRNAVGKIFEIFGPVPHPFYVVRFNSKEHVDSTGIKMKDAMYFAPSVEDFTQYIIPDVLKREKGSDASWTNDQEPPPDAVDYSDDEKEREAKHAKHGQNPGKKKQKSDQGKGSSSDQKSHPSAQRFSRPYSRNNAAPRFSRGGSSHTQENAYGQYHQPYYHSNFPGEYMMQQSYTYHNANSQEYALPLSSDYHAPMPNMFDHYGNMQAFPPPPPPHMNWPSQNPYPYMQSPHLFNMPPPPPPPPPPAPPNSGAPSY